MKRGASLMISAVLIAAYVIMEYRSGALLASIAFTLPALAVGLTIVFLVVRVYRHAPIAEDTSWPAFFTSLLGTHSFIIAGLAGVPLIAEHPVLPVQYVCMVLLASSYPLAVYALLVLGGSWSILPEAKKLVTNGPYRWSRHPLYALYLFSCLMLVGVGQSLTVAALALASVALQFARARREERVLPATFGDEYEDYLKTTGWFGRRAVR